MKKQNFKFDVLKKKKENKLVCYNYTQHTRFLETDWRMDIIGAALVIVYNYFIRGISHYIVYLRLLFANQAVLRLKNISHIQPILLALMHLANYINLYTTLLQNFCNFCNFLCNYLGTFVSK